MTRSTVFLAIVFLLTCEALCFAFTTKDVGSTIPSAVTRGIKMTAGDDVPPVSYRQPDNVISNNALAEEAGYPTIILAPFPEAADPSFIVKGPIGCNDFEVTREGGPTAEELTNENLIQIVERRSNVTDLEVNTLVWKCLGYRFDPEKEEWGAPEVFPKWKERYPTPPDVIGMQRIYTKEIDGELIKNNQRLTNSIPVEFKQSLKTYLKPYGFNGYKLSELVPNMTRRAQCVNWLLFFREDLFGYTVEELRERRRMKKEKEAEEERKQLEETGEKEWKPPVREVF
mmetsp:Transcript_8951/g.18595  ORF Transcript_8951/g.18595 Transcript_8951/m.18595 type:complete len:285 (-) Transcript_8951:42-896(-)